LQRSRCRHADIVADATLIQAASAPEALGAVELYADFDLILLDMALPGMDGLTLLPELRRRMPTSPIVVLSGTVDNTTARAVLAAGRRGLLGDRTLPSAAWARKPRG
jgi:CheY-like chemotaxis protein